MTSQRKKLQPASPKNLEMYPQGSPFSLNEAATVAEAVGVVDAEDAEDAVHTVDTVEAVQLETGTKVSPPIAKLTAILQMHAGSRNVPRREETTEETTKETSSSFASSAGFQDTSKSIASPTNV
jgi:hypothetical protein